MLLSVKVRLPLEKIVLYYGEDVPENCLPLPGHPLARTS